MELKEFADGPAQTGIYSLTESHDMFLHFTASIKPKLDCVTTPRAGLKSQVGSVCEMFVFIFYRFSSMFPFKMSRFVTVSNPPRIAQINGDTEDGVTASNSQWIVGSSLWVMDCMDLQTGLQPTRFILSSRSKAKFLLKMTLSSSLMDPVAHSTFTFDNPSR